MRRPFIIPLVGGALVALGWFAGQRADSVTRVSFLAVGQGDCVLFQHAGTAVLFDTGPSPETARYTILPELRRLGVANIDTIFLSHPDGDHVSGTAEILKSYPHAKVAISAEFRRHEELARLLGEWKVQPLWLPPKQEGMIGDFKLSIVNPPVGANDNDGSMVVQLDNGTASLQLSGDAPEYVEEAVARGGDWQAQVMKAGHHGSRTSTSDAWLQEVRPEFVVLSCGRANSYGHPHPEVLQRIKAAHAVPLRTDEHGTITFEAGTGKFNLRR